MERIDTYFSIIQNTKLLCNTKKELGELLGYSISSGNGLKRMGRQSLFMKKALLSGLSQIVKERAGLDLVNLLRSYIEADGLYQDIPKRYRRKETALKLVKWYYGGDPESDDITAVKGKVKDCHIAFLVLRLLGVLPSVNSRGGDVNDHDIEQYYNGVLGFLRSVTEGGFHAEKLPALAVAEHESQQGKIEKNRLHLIKITKMVLDAYRSSLTRYDLTRLNMMMADTEFDPEIEGIWTEDEKSTVFWRLEPIVNGYFMYRIKLKSDFKKLSYIKYHIRFFQDDEGVLALVMRPQIINYLVQGLPIPSNVFAYFDFAITDGLIALGSRPGNDPWFGLKRLTRSSHAEYFQRLIDSEDWMMVDECSECSYEMLSTLVAVTRSAIYLKTHFDGDEDDFSGPYYRVPKSLDEDVLDQVNLNCVAGVMTFGDGRKYLAFNEQRLYYDVSTPEKMAELGIEVVDTITG